MAADVFRFEMSDPEDTRHFRAILREVSAHDAERIAIVGKTEGTATLNDFGRSLASRAIIDALADAKVRAQPHIVLSMGGEGLSRPVAICLLTSLEGNLRCLDLPLG